MNDYKEKFEKYFPNGFFIDQEDTKGIEKYLKKAEVLNDGELIEQLEKAGEGNMNLTLRVKTNQRSFILKQSRPWVEKYPQIDAPATRSETETVFYKLASLSESVSSKMPKLLKTDVSSSVMILEDLGSLDNLDKLYHDNTKVEVPWKVLGEWLAQLHSIEVPEKYVATLQNKDMKLLNHAHIYDIPLQQNNGIDLNAISEGLSEAAQFLLEDDNYKTKVKSLGELYLKDGNTLLHGDYYPGSWLGNLKGEIFIIDPEFCFVGEPAFDLGVTAAHMAICNLYENSWNQFFEAYTSVREVDNKLVHQFAGVEIMRRILGVAQLPISYSTSHKKKLLELSYKWVMA